jgi:hypothetical protein
MENGKGVDGSVRLEDAGVSGSILPGALGQPVPEFREVCDSKVEIPDQIQEEHDFLLKIKLNDPCRETLPTDHAQCSVPGRGRI